MKFSRDSFAFTVQQNVPATVAILDYHTLYKTTLGRVLTTKYFIGQVNDDDFKIIGASAQSPACVLTGKLQAIDAQTTLVEIETTLHRAYIILFTIWTVIAAGALTIPALVHFNPKLLFAGIAGALAGAIVFRLSLHLFYVIARNKSIRKIESILQ